ncbi:HIT family protein [Streptomyces sp. NPDC057521]|uniref:HIT family protein n=1 Tax=Streptomyces sp. NPDC057521 TaxID=3346156 RepID=UPI00369EBF80
MYALRKEDHRGTLEVDPGHRLGFSGGQPPRPLRACKGPSFAAELLAETVEHAVRDLEEPAYLALMSVVRKVALAVEAVFEPERTYLLSLGSQQGNAHLHWHIAGLPPGTPYRKQQFHALMTENGALSYTEAEAASLGERLRAALAEE